MQAVGRCGPKTITVVGRYLKPESGDSFVFHYATPRNDDGRGPQREHVKHGVLVLNLRTTTADDWGEGYEHLAGLLRYDIGDTEPESPTRSYWIEQILYPKDELCFDPDQGGGTFWELGEDAWTFTGT